MKRFRELSEQSFEAQLVDFIEHDEDLTEGIQLDELRVLSVMQRRKLKHRMRRLARSGSFKMKRKLAMRRVASRDKLLKRAAKLAKKLVIKRLFGPKIAKQYSMLPPMKRVRIDQRVATKGKRMFDRLKKKLLIKVRKKDLERRQRMLNKASNQS